MTEKKNNVPAFPNVNEMGYGDIGMSLRDYFAAKAMQGMLSNNKINPISDYEFCLKCYNYADAMLKAREE